jgi:predicted RNA binding protein YcfA (HicA-like mRNA interferase family)
MARTMNLGDLIRAMRKNGCSVAREGSRHTFWRCGCGQHATAVPRHGPVAVGTVASIERSIGCLPKGWLK